MFLREYTTSNATVSEPVPYETYHAQPGEKVFCPKCGSVTLFTILQDDDDFKEESHECPKCGHCFSVEFYQGQLDEDDVDPRQSPLDFAIADGKLQISIGLDTLTEDVVRPSIEIWSKESWTAERINKKSGLMEPYPHVTKVRIIDETKFLNAFVDFLKKLDGQHEGIKHDLHHITEQLLNHYDDSRRADSDVGLEYILTPDKPAQ